MKKHLKRILATVMTVAIILCAAPLNGFVGLGALKFSIFDVVTLEANATDTIKEDGAITYSINEGKATVKDCDPEISGIVEIPEQIDGIPVVKIGSYSFSGCSKIGTITIPNSILGQHRTILI